MNEGENSGVPKSPVFSSPDASPESSEQLQPTAAPDQQSGQMIVSSPDDAAGVSPQAVQGSARPKQRINFGFTRKFAGPPATQQQTVMPNNTPDFFNQAVNDVVLADEEAVAKKQKTKKIVLLSAIALGALGIILIVVLLAKQAGRPSANTVKTAFNRYANYVLYGEEKDSDIGGPSNDVRYTIMDKYINVDDNYNKRFKELFETFYEKYNAAAESGLYEKGGMDGYRGTVQDVYASFYLENVLGEQEIIRKFIDFGTSGITKDIDESVNTYGSGHGNNYIDYWAKSKETYLNMVAYLDEHHCLPSDYRNYGDIACDINMESDEGYNNARSQYEEYLDKMRSEAIFERQSIYNQMFNIKQELYEK